MKFLSALIGACLLSAALGALSVGPVLAQSSEQEIIHIAPGQIQTLETPPWERPIDEKRTSWENDLRTAASAKFSGNLREAAGAAATEGFKALDALDLASASRAFSEAAVLDPDSPYPYLGFVDIYRVTMKYEKMQFCLKAAVERSSKQRMALMFLGMNFGISGDYQTAVGFFNSVLELDANDQQAHLMLAKTYRLLNDPQQADHHEKLAKD